MLWELVLRLFERLVKPKRVACPVCGWTGWQFRAFVHEHGVTKYAMCDSCRTGSRARALAWYLRQMSRLRQGLICVDFGPRLPYEVIFREYGCQLLNVDLVMGEIDIRMDITNLAFKDNSLDLVICYHVLEHVPQDLSALSELHRVLRPSGELLLQVPWDPRKKVTLEYSGRDWEPKDHVREYGYDILEKIAEAGFDITLRDDTDGLTASERTAYGIHSAVSFICKKTPLSLIQKQDPLPPHCGDWSIKWQRD